YSLDTMVVNFQNMINRLIDGINYFGGAFGVTLQHISASDTGLSNFADKIHNELVLNIKEAEEASKNAMKVWSNAENETGFMNWVNEVKKKSLEVAQIMVDTKK